MMNAIKYCTLLFSILLLSFTTNAQTDWVTKQIDEKISIKFPSDPEKTTNNNADVFILKGADSVAYSGGVIDLKNFGKLDSTTLASMKDNQKFADQLVGGIASQKKNYKFGAVTIGKWEMLTVYTVNAYDDANKNKLFVKMIIIGSKLYSFTCRIPDKLDIKKSELFLNSIELSK